MALKDFAPAIVSGLSTIGGWLGIGEKRQDRRQISQQTKLNEINSKTSKELADYENEGKLKMWKDTNYGAQLEEAEKAGVSKAAAIGGSGTGTQGASVNSAGGGAAADAAATTNARTAQIQMGMQLASQLALQRAQKENIEADTANKIAQTEGTGITNEVNKATIPDQIRKIVFNADKELGESMSAFQQGKIDESTREAQIQKIKAESIGSIIENEAKKTSIKVDKQKIKQMSESIAQGWEGLKQGESKLAIDKFKAEIEANYPGLLNTMGRVIDDSIDMLFKLKNGRETQKIIK